MAGDHRHPAQRQGQRAILQWFQAFTAGHHGHGDGEDDLALHNQAGQAGGDIAVDGNEQQAELAHPNGDTIAGQDAPRNGRPAHEEDQREHHGGKAQGGKQQRRQAVQRGADDGEIAAPHHHHRQRQQQGARAERGAAHRGLASM